MYSTAGTTVQKALYAEQIKTYWMHLFVTLGTDINYVVSGKPLCQIKRTCGFLLQHVLVERLELLDGGIPYYHQRCFLRLQQMYCFCGTKRKQMDGTGL